MKVEKSEMVVIWTDEVGVDSWKRSMQTVIDKVKALKLVYDYFGLKPFDIDVIKSLTSNGAYSIESELRKKLKGENIHDLLIDVSIKGFSEKFLQLEDAIKAVNKSLKPQVYSHRYNQLLPCLTIENIPFDGQDFEITEAVMESIQYKYFTIKLDAKDKQLVDKLEKKATEMNVLIASINENLTDIDAITNVNDFVQLFDLRDGVLELDKKRLALMLNPNNPYNH